MRGFVITELVGPGGGHLADDLPEPDGAHPWGDGGRLVIDVKAAGVSYPDLLQTRGQYQHATPPPYVPGGEVAGLVLEAPEGSRFAPGDRVAGLTVWGGLAERALALPNYTVRLPDAMSWDDGAASWLNYSTAWFSLRRIGFEKGETVLVHGAAGGVGTATLQLVRAYGGIGIGMVSTEEKARVAMAAGAHHTVSNGASDWVQQVKDLTDGHGVAVVVDPVGGDHFIDSLRSLDVGGRLAVVGFAGGEIPTVKVNRLLLRDLSVVGVALDPYARRHPAVVDQLQEELESAMADGIVRPIIGHRLPLADSRRALELIDERQALGKIVVSVAD